MTKPKKSEVKKEWRQYEQQVFAVLRERFNESKICKIEDNKFLPGFWSETKRQVDILVTIEIASLKLVGVYDCKKFDKLVTVPTIDSMIGFMNDVRADFGGLVTTKGFRPAAKKRANQMNSQLDIIPFVSPEALAETLAMYAREQLRRRRLIAEDDDAWSKLCEEDEATQTTAKRRRAEFTVWRLQQNPPTEDSPPTLPVNRKQPW
jgi:hypothetical protein